MHNTVRRSTELCRQFEFSISKSKWETTTDGWYPLARLTIITNYSPPRSVYTPPSRNEGKNSRLRHLDASSDICCSMDMTMD